MANDKRKKIARARREGNGVVINLTGILEPGEYYEVTKDKKDGRAFITLFKVETA